MDDDSEKHGKVIDGIPFLGGSKYLLELARKKEVALVVMAITHKQQPQLLEALLECGQHGIKTIEMPILYEELTGKVPVRHMGENYWPYGISSTIPQGWLTYPPKDFVLLSNIRRVMDISIALASLILSLPVTIIAVIAIKLDSEGPIFYNYRQISFSCQNKKTRAKTSRVWNVDIGLWWLL